MTIDCTYQLASRSASYRHATFGVLSSTVGHPALSTRHDFNLIVANRHLLGILTLGEAVQVVDRPGCSWWLCIHFRPPSLSSGRHRGHTGGQPGVQKLHTECH